MSAHRNLQMCPPIKKILNKLGDSYNTYINYHKTHTMATCYGGIGKPLEKDSDPQENDMTIHDEYQAEIHDFENVEPDHQAGIKRFNS